MKTIDRIDVKLNRLKSEKAALEQRLKKSDNNLRMKRSRTLIQAGGILDMLDFLKLFDLETGDDLQLDINKKDNSMMMIGYFLDVKEQTPNTFTDDQKKRFLLKGQMFLNARERS